MTSTLPVAISSEEEEWVLCGALPQLLQAQWHPGTNPGDFRVELCREVSGCCSCMGHPAPMSWSVLNRLTSSWGLDTVLWSSHSTSANLYSSSILWFNSQLPVLSVCWPARNITHFYFNKVKWSVQKATWSSVPLLFEATSKTTLRTAFHSHLSCVEIISCTETRQKKNPKHDASIQLLESFMSFPTKAAFHVFDFNVWFKVQIVCGDANIFVVIEF